jgi:hypothetical protein
MTDTPSPNVSRETIDEVIDAVVAGLKGHPQYRKEPTMTDTTPPTVRRRPDAAAIEQRYHAAMFCWNMAVDADIKARRCRDAGDHEGAKRWLTTVAHYHKNYARLQYTDK